MIKPCLRKILPAALALSLILTACDKKEDVPAETTGSTPAEIIGEPPAETTAEITAKTTEEDTRIFISSHILAPVITTEPPELSPKEQLEAALKIFSDFTYTDYEGTKHFAYEAVSGSYNGDPNHASLFFDFGEIGYPCSFYYDTLSSPQLFDENLELIKSADEVYPKLKEGNPIPFEVRKGQTLENGMTVEKAETSFLSDQGRTELSSGTVEMKGSLTLRGVLCRAPSEDPFDFPLPDPDAITFYTDISYNNLLPCSCYQGNYGLMGFYSRKDDKTGFAFATSAPPVACYENNTDLSQLFTDSDYVIADITFSDIHYHFFNGGSLSGTVVKAEKVKDVF